MENGGWMWWVIPHDDALPSSYPSAFSFGSLGFGSLRFWSLRFGSLRFFHHASNDVSCVREHRDNYKIGHNGDHSSDNPVRRVRGHKWGVGSHQPNDLRGSRFMRPISIRILPIKMIVFIFIGHKGNFTHVRGAFLFKGTSSGFGNVSDDPRNQVRATFSLHLRPLRISAGTSGLRER